MNFGKSQLLNCWTLVNKKKARKYPCSYFNKLFRLHNCIYETGTRSLLSFLVSWYSKNHQKCRFEYSSRNWPKCATVFWRKISDISNRSSSSYKVRFGFGFGSSLMTKVQVRVRLEKIQKFKFDLSLRRNQTSINWKVTQCLKITLKSLIFYNVLR